MEKQRIYPEETPPQNIPYSSTDKRYMFSHIVPGQGVIIEKDQNGVLYISTGIEKVATPVVSILGNTLSVSCETDGAEIYYTVNGKTPSAYSLLYSDPIEVQNTTEFRFVAIKNGMVNSDEATINFNPHLFRLQAVSNSCSISMQSGNNKAPKLQVSRDGENFTDWPYTSTDQVHSFSPINIKYGEVLYVRGDNTAMAGSEAAVSTFVMSGNVAAYGNIMYLLSYDGNGDTASKNAFTCLFKDCDTLQAAPDMPATTLGEQCYKRMYMNCKSLGKAPDLPAADMSPDECYSEMYNGCSQLSLVSVNLDGAWMDENSKDWLAGVAENGEFYKPSKATIPDGPDGIPAGWVVKERV